MPRNAAKDADDADVKNAVKDATHDAKNVVDDAAHDAKNDAEDAAKYSPGIYMPPDEVAAPRFTALSARTSQPTPGAPQASLFSEGGRMLINLLEMDHRRRDHRLAGQHDHADECTAGHTA